MRTSGGTVSVSPGSAVPPTLLSWQPGTVYTKGQLATYGGWLWMANSGFTSGASFDPSNWTLVAAGAGPEATNLLAAGESTVNRDDVVASVLVATGVLNLAFFTATKSEAIGHLRMVGGNIAAGGLTLAQLALYAVSAAGDLTLVANTASDTTLFTSVNTAWTRALTASYNKQAGQRYAAGLLLTGTTMPNVMGAICPTGFGVELALAPATAAKMGGLSSLPASIPAASLASTTVRFYAGLAA